MDNLDLNWPTENEQQGFLKLPLELQDIIVEQSHIMALAENNGCYRKNDPEKLKEIGEKIIEMISDTPIKEEVNVLAETIQKDLGNPETRRKYDEASKEFAEWEASLGNEEWAAHF